MARRRRNPEVKELPQGHTYRKRGYRYMVDFRTAEGERVTKLYRHGEKQEADDYVAIELTKLENHGTSTAAILSDRNLREAAECIRRLRERGKSLSDATDHYLAFLEANEKSWPVSKLIEAVEHSKDREGKSPRYLADLTSRFSRFSASFGDRPVASISAEEISDWLAGLSLSAISRNNYRRLLVLLFNEGIRRKVCQTNPAREAEKAKVVESEPSILTPTQAAKLLECASDKILPAIAISLFAGLRQSEVEQLDWSEVDFDEKLILVKAEKAKSARRRYVKMSANLRAWLLPFRCKRGPVSPNGTEYWTEFDRARKGAKLLDRWKGNECRHSFASYHLAHHRDPGATTTELGHTSPHLVFQHYRNLVKASDAKIYWNITPAPATSLNRKRTGT